MTYEQVILIDGFPVPAAVFNAMSAELASRSAAGLGIVARANRTTSSSSTTSEVGVLRLDSVPISAGRMYRIWTSPMIFQSTVANDLINAHIRYSTAGTATTGSTQLTGLVDNAASASGPQRTKGMTVPWVPVATGVASILLSVSRDSGTGSVALNASSPYPIDLVIEDCGADPGSTGVIL
jgi:hypothetical protein